MRFAISVLLFFTLTLPAAAWNDKGHMIIARLAWNQLSEAERAKAISILKRHPDYHDYLAAQRPKGFAEDEWVFVRAACWADWIRDERNDDRDHWHQISYPFVPAGSKINAKSHEPPSSQENVVTQLPICVRKIERGKNGDRAQNLAWVLHLVGDIHQPL